MTNLEICELERADEANWDAYVYDLATSTFHHQLRSVLIKRFKSLMNEPETDIALHGVRDDRSGKDFIHIKNLGYAQFPERPGFCRKTVTSHQCTCYDTGMQG